MQYEKSCGALVYRKFHGNIELLLIKHTNSGNWAFPKGHMESEESEPETAVREIFEETGVEVIINTEFREKVSFYPKKNIKKDVVYFLAKAINFEYTPQIEEVAKIKWVEINNAHSMLSYENDRQLVSKAKSIIKATV